MLFSSSNITGHLESILIVDDDGMILSLLSLGFEKCGFKVLKAENGLDAWNIFNSEQIDVILTDIQMPGLTGEELSRKVRNQSPHTKIAVMSGGGTDVAAGLLNEGTADYLFWKPFEVKKICKILKADAQVATSDL
jgi:DNA-binding response OmpR family regulator